MDHMPIGSSDVTAMPEVISAQMFSTTPLLSIPPSAITLADGNTLLPETVTEACEKLAAQNTSDLQSMYFELYFEIE